MEGWAWMCGVGTRDRDRDMDRVRGTGDMTRGGTGQGGELTGGGRTR